MASEILGLFTSPEEYQMRQQQAQQNRALQFAQLNPFEKASYGIYQGAGQLGQAAGSLFGVQDPQLRMISQRQMLSKEIDPSDPESIMRAARKAAQLNDQQFALTLADYGRKAQSDLALAQQRGRIDVPDKIQAGRELNKLVLQREGFLAQGISANSPQVRALEAEINSLQRVARGEKIPDVIEISNRRADLQGEIDTLTAQQRDTPTAENAQKILTAKRQLEGLPLPSDKASTEVARDAQIEVIDRQLANPEMSNQERANLEARRDRLLGTKEAKGNIKEIGTAKKGGDVVYLDVNNDQQYIYKTDKATGNQIRVPFTGEVDRATSSSTVNVTSGAGEKEVIKGLAKLDVDDIQIARENKRTAIASNQALQKLKSLDDNGLITGAFAKNRVGAANLFNTLGLLSKKDSADLAASQEYQKVGADLIFQSLRGKLGAGISNADRDFIRELFPQLETSAAARRQLIEYIAEKNNAVIKEADAAEAWIRKNKSFEGYKPLIDGVFDPRVSTGVKAMSTEDIKAAIARQKAQGK